MAFLFIPWLEPTSKFLYCIPFNISMIIMGVIILGIALYTVFESKIYFPNDNIFGFLSKEIYMIIEIVIAIIVFLGFLVKKKPYKIVVYVFTIALAGFGLAVNIHKLSSFKVDKEISNGDIRACIKWIYFIRIAGEFAIELYFCYIVYSIWKQDDSTNQI